MYVERIVLIQISLWLIFEIPVAFLQKTNDLAISDILSQLGKNLNRFFSVYYC